MPRSRAEGHRNKWNRPSLRIRAECPCGTWVVRRVPNDEWGAAQAFRDGRRAGIAEIVFRPSWRFLRTYFLQLGVLDGMHGFVLCSLQAFGVFLKYGRLWEHGLRSARGESTAAGWVSGR